MARVTTRAGDDGYTRVLAPGRLPKEHPRIEALGTLDEATSALGLARAQSPTPRVVEVVLRLQRELYVLMGELAGAGTAIGPAKVAALEALADELKREVEIPSVFIIPGATVSSAALDVARTVVRRGERVVARLVHEGEVDNPDALRYLNRCSDLLHVLARYDEVSQGVDLQTQG
jgi:cob(I)alamin adenosyltransferase